MSVIQHIHQACSIYGRVMSLEEKELQEIPESVRRRIHYLNKEIPAVLCRGNSKEVLAMTRAINTSYRTLDHILASSLKQQGPELDKIIHYLKKRFSAIVKNSAKMVTDFHR
ncbi:MAG: hypothetical protein HQL31_13160 [Planctomycetes bacterium]|nr:hypothetical protein [Planctomycetota bacterium]